MQAPALLIKELQTMARQRSTYVLLVLFLLCSALFIGGVTQMVWVGNDFLLASHNLIVFGVLMSVQGCMVVLVLPAICATLITREKEQATLGLLMMSGLSRRSIIVDKILARMILLLVLSLSVAPAMVYLLNQGGLAPIQIMRCYGVLFSLALAYAGLAVLISARAYTVIGAIVATYLSMIVVFGIQLVSGVALMFADVIQDEAMVTYLALLWPFVWGIPIDGELPLIVGLSDYWYLFLLVNGAFFAGCVWIAARILPRYQERPSKKRKERKDRLSVRFLNLFGSLGRRLARAGGSPGRNPVTWRETSRGILTSTRVQVVVAIIVLGASAAYYTIAVIADSRDMLALGWVVIWLLLVPTLILITLLGGCLNFVAEHRRGYFDVLLSTPLTAAAIIRGKVMGQCKSSIPAAVGLCLVLLMGAMAETARNSYADWDSELILACVTIGSVVLGGTLTIALSGMLAGLVAVKPMPAILLSLVFIAAYAWIQVCVSWLFAFPLALLDRPDRVAGALGRLVDDLDIGTFIERIHSDEWVVSIAYSGAAFVTPVLITLTLILVAPSLLYRDRMD